MDAKRNLKTVRLFDELEYGIATLGPAKVYIKTLARRIAYLHKKQATDADKLPRENFLMQEVESLFALLALYAIHEGADLRATLLRYQDADAPVNVARYDTILADLRRRHERRTADAAVAVAA